MTKFCEKENFAARSEHRTKRIFFEQFLQPTTWHAVARSDVKTIEPSNT